MPSLFSPHNLVVTILAYFCPRYYRDCQHQYHRLRATIVYVFSTYHLILSLKVDHQSRNESDFSASKRRKPLYSVPHAWLYSPISSTSAGKLPLSRLHSFEAFSESS